MSSKVSRTSKKTEDKETETNRSQWKREVENQKNIKQKEKWLSIWYNKKNSL